MAALQTCSCQDTGQAAAVSGMLIQPVGHYNSE